MQEQTYTLDTEPFAARQGVKPQTVRARYCRFGHYFGVKPLKLANGRLKWPDVQVEAANAGEAATGMQND